MDLLPPCPSLPFPLALPLLPLRCFDLLSIEKDLSSGFEDWIFDIIMGKCDEDEDYLIQILVWLPVVSLLRFKSVCKSWRALIESSFFIDLHTTTTFNSPSKFGSFILHALVPKRSLTHSSNTTGGGGVDELFPENAVIMLSSQSESESGGWCWINSSTDGDGDGDDHDHVFKVDNNNLVVGSSNLGFPSCYKSLTPAPTPTRTRTPSTVTHLFTHTQQLIGSCNGLICLLDGNILYGPMEFSLWNPATRQFRILPKYIITKNEEEDDAADQYEDGAMYYSFTEVDLNEDAGGDRFSSLIAFGFDVETKDYKVVLITSFRPKNWCGGDPMECRCRVQVYSLITDSWRILEGITSLPAYPDFETFPGLYLNGCCFFLAKFLPTKHQMSFPKNDRFIISFDLTKEIITTVEIPDHDRNQTLYLCYLGDKLALFTVSSPYVTFDGVNYIESENFDHEDYDIWVLNEHVRSSRSNSNNYSVSKESWKKLHSFQIKTRAPRELNIPRVISNDGEFALLDTVAAGSPKMKLYNLVTKEVKKEFLSSYGLLSTAAEVYKPTLVSIIGGNGCGSSRSIG